MFKRINKQHQLELTYDLEELTRGYTIVDTSIGPLGEVCVLAVNKVPNREEGMFPPTKTNEGHDYKAIIISTGNIREIILNNQRWNYHFIQTIERENILLVCARSNLYENGTFDNNAKVFDSEGNLLREFLLGDGIQSLYVTKENKIWTSYFDEGIFGNYGWTDPIGQYGLRAWDSDGEELYKYPNIEQQFISDCYALNVVSDEEVWFYFYTDFELGKYHNGKIEYITPGVDGSDGFTVYKDYLFFRGGYSEHDKYILFQEIPNNKLKRVSNLELIDETKNPIKANHISCRGPLLLITTGTKIYITHLKDIIAGL
ncbi:hypothetical protein JOC85_003619 [Bacillus mesophilus]|uniref:6-bladed beta-propeller n=1 Tax=Bacillus mesophilus TaxID=1808955 RepID=A0A6M0QCG4_9BACI|nr:hypothetical protein [Bacillus mesophilus]MBM7662808.1 hypothetical protein [Bacillus mesophilus]NEY73399.1 hypothetical protein [Bacillus mesophilus]